MKEDALEYLARRVRGHQAGLLLDTNVLLVYLADKTSDQLAGTWKQTEGFTSDHVILIRGLVNAAHRLVTTPHILTEASDLADHGVPRRWRTPLRVHLREFMLNTRERHVEAQVVAKDDDILKFGLADLAQAFLSGRKRPLVVTTDADVTGALERRRLPVVNLNHYVFPT
jgi:hypothetical protein